MRRGHGNDRLLLGLKGGLNEYELDLLRQRSLSARYEKARRGELVVSAPVGFVKAGDRYETRSHPAEIAKHGWGREGSVDLSLTIGADGLKTGFTKEERTDKHKLLGHGRTRGLDLAHCAASWLVVPLPVSHEVADGRQHSPDNCK